MTAVEIARAVFPDEPDNILEGLIWEYTGFPCFWHTDNPVKEMSHQLRQFRWKSKNGKPVGIDEQWEAFKKTQEYKEKMCD